MSLRYVISDIHGCNKTLRALILDRISLSKHDQLYLLGDYVDRGPDSKGVLDFIMELKEKGIDLRIIRGNHDQLMLDSLSEIRNYQNWLFNGAENTLRSFKKENPSDIPQKYFDFIHAMEYYVELEDAYLVHAGFNFKSRNVFEDVEAMMNIRKMSIDNNIVRHKKIIHGHTPQPLSEIRKSVDSGWQEINIDNGCVFGQVEGYGCLVALELNEMKLVWEPYVG